MRILINGGGIAGLTLAGLLKKKGIESVIVEKYAQWTDPVGFGLAIWDVGRRVLRELGVDQDLIENGYEVPEYAMRNQAGELLSLMPLGDIAKEFGPVTMIERWRLHEMLRKAAADVTKYLGVTITDLSQDESGVTVTFSNGATDRFDLLVGCDGVHSPLREKVFGVPDPKYYGWTSWLLWIPEGIPLSKGVTQLWGNKSFFVLYPGGEKHPSAAYFAALNAPRQPDPVETRLTRLKHLFKDYGWIVPQVLDTFQDPKQMFHDDLAKVIMDEWVKGRVVLTGDAEHAMSPLIGMGGSMAMEDSFVLADEISKAAPETLGDALVRYRERRAPRIKYVQETSRKFWNWVAMDNKLLCAVRNVAARVAPRWYFFGNFKNILRAAV